MKHKIAILYVYVINGETVCSITRDGLPNRHYQLTTKRANIVADIITAKCGSSATVRPFTGGAIGYVAYLR